MAGQAQPGLGERVRRSRQMRGLKQSELAGQDISASYLSLIESGKREPNADVLLRLAATLQVEAEYLLTGAQPVDALRLRTDLALARLALDEGRASEGLGLLANLDGAVARTVLSPQELGDGLLLRANAHERLGDLKAAVAVLEDLRVQAEISGGTLPWLPVLVALCRCYRDSGDVARAVDLAEMGLRRCEELGLRGVDAHTQLVSTLAGIYGDRGDLLRAATLLDSLLERLESAGGPPQERGYAYWNAAMAAAERGERGEALRLVERAAALIGEGDDERNHARIKIARAWIILGQPDPDGATARNLLRGALPALRRHASIEDLAKAETQLAWAEIALHRPDVARRHAVRAVARLGDGHPLATADAKCALAGADLAAGDRAGAAQCLEDAARALSAVNAPRQASALWRQLAGIYKLIGQSDDAMRALECALDLLGVPEQPVPAPPAGDRAPSTSTQRRSAYRQGAR